MKLIDNTLQDGTGNNEETAKKPNVQKIVKSMFLILIFSWILLLQSCAVFVHGPGGHGRHGGHGNNGNHDHNERNR